ncbi:phospholipase D-like domain-containing protein [Trueperella pecoris]|uniref:phospholipase D-like domain-containing protein n=1 Tax=Trueperella pecoris TaxID=2733571 RepID=UPI00186B9997|nr:phospholipase D-like domain-containing protein [Trueperella pecoris]QOQ39365.1 hypothetical protein HLG82_07890 [Trueperella pecoris]
MALIKNPVGAAAKAPESLHDISALMRNAKANVRGHTPYLIANQRMYDVLAGAAAQVPTTIFTNSPFNNANVIGAGDFIIQKNKIKKLGADVLLSSKARSYHGKVFTIDDELIGVGSFNWDMRSAYIISEVMLVERGREFFAANVGKLDFYEADAYQLQRQPDAGAVRSAVKDAGAAVKGAGAQAANRINHAIYSKTALLTLIVTTLYPFRFLF